MKGDEERRRWPCHGRAKDSEMELISLGHLLEMGWGRGRSQDSAEASGVGSWTEKVMM